MKFLHKKGQMITLVINFGFRFKVQFISEKNPLIVENSELNPIILLCYYSSSKIRIFN